MWNKKKTKNYILKEKLKRELYLYQFSYLIILSVLNDTIMY